jgi:hypothetical protein
MKTILSRLRAYDAISIRRPSKPMRLGRRRARREAPAAHGSSSSHPREPSLFPEKELESVES